MDCCPDRKQGALELRVIAVGSAVRLAGIDTIYVARGTISAVYLLDAVLEIGLVWVWVYAWRQGPRAGAGTTPAATQWFVLPNPSGT